MSDNVRFERQYRTAASEGYHLLDGEQRIGHVDLHYTQRDVYASLILEADMTEGALLDLIERIDDALVLSAEVARDDFLVTVYRGQETGFYSDDFLAERASRRAAPDSRRGELGPRSSRHVGSGHCSPGWTCVLGYERYTRGRTAVAEKASAGAADQALLLNSSSEDGDKYGLVSGNGEVTTDRQVLALLCQEVELLRTEIADLRDSLASRPVVRHMMLSGLGSGAVSPRTTDLGLDRRVR